MHFHSFLTVSKFFTISLRKRSNYKNELGLYFKCHPTFYSCHADDPSPRLLGHFIVASDWCDLCCDYHLQSQIINLVSKGYIELSRNTPLLIQVFFSILGFLKLA